MQVHPGGVDTKIPMKTHNPLETARADTSKPATAGMINN